MTSILIYTIGWRRYWFLATQYDRVRDWVNLHRAARQTVQAVEELEHKLTGILARYSADGRLDCYREFEDICDDIDTHIEQQCVDAIRDHISSHVPAGPVH